MTPDPPPSGAAPSSGDDLTPTWTSSDKDVVTTSQGSGRIWATLGHGILNEVYWPSTGEPQIRDLGFILSTPAGWVEVKRAARYAITQPAPDVPLPTVEHKGEGYRLRLDIVADPERDALLIRYRLSGEGCRCYPLLAPRLGPEGRANRVFAGGTLLAEGAGRWLCLVACQGFAKASAGVVGTSDGWQDFDRNGAMTWTYATAGPGNVALMGELAANEGLLALGFGMSRDGAETLTRSTIVAGFEAAHGAAQTGWKAWARRLDIPRDGMSRRCLDLARRSAAVMRCHEDRTFPGAVVASLSVPWGNARDDPGGYHLVWARDAVNTGLAFLATGQADDARRMLAYLVAMQHPDGHWAQNFYADGRPFWRAVQLDEVAFPVILAERLREAGELPRDAGSHAQIAAMVARAADFIARTGPVTPQDRWEENAGLSPFTLAVCIAALVAAAGWAEGDQRLLLLETADGWNARIEEWTYATDSAFAQDAGVEGHYVRIAPEAGRPLSEQWVEVRNRGGFFVPATDLVGLEFLALVRYGLRAPDDPRILSSLTVAEAVLGRDLPCGRAYYRYNGDGYGEHADGRPFDGQGIGRCWPLLTGERGHFAVQAGEDGQPWLKAMAAMTSRWGLLPEQVWDVPDDLGRLDRLGSPTGAAMPLAWAHAEYLKLSRIAVTKRPVEHLLCVEERYN